MYSFTKNAAAQEYYFKKFEKEQKLKKIKLPFGKHNPDCCNDITLSYGLFLQCEKNTKGLKILQEEIAEQREQEKKEIKQLKVQNSILKMKLKKKEDKILKIKEIEKQEEMLKIKLKKNEEKQEEMLKNIDEKNITQRGGMKELELEDFNELEFEDFGRRMGSL
jgi:hypothetical protein